MGKTNPPIERWSKDMSKQIRKEEIQTANNQRSALGVFAAIKCARLTCVYGLARYLWYSVGRKESGGSFKSAGRAGIHYGELCDSGLVHILLENKRKVFRIGQAEKRAWRLEHILMAPYPRQQTCDLTMGSGEVGDADPLGGRCGHCHTLHLLGIHRSWLLLSLFVLPLLVSFFPLSAG